MAENKQKMSNKQDNKGISARLRTLRAEYNYTQADVARELGISQQTYSKYESQDTNIDSATIKKICEFYGVSADYLLDTDKYSNRASVSKTAYSKSTEEIEMIVDMVISKINGQK